MKIYGANLSPFVRKVLTVCALKELEYEHVIVMPGNFPDGYLKISPLGKIPALEDGELTISDSSVICEYLEERYPAIPTMPTDLAERARARWLEEYGDSKFVEAVATFFLRTFVKASAGIGGSRYRTFGTTSEGCYPRAHGLSGRAATRGGVSVRHFEHSRYCPGQPPNHR